nr:sodium:proton antiporter [Salinicola sp. S1-1-2]
MIRSRIGWSLVGGVVLAGLIWLVAREWQQIGMQVVLWQGRLYHALVDAVGAINRAPGVTTWSVLLGVSFGYGVFHAAGPGHGKVVLSTYLASQGGAWRRALGLSLLASLLQGVTAILLVAVLVFGFGWLTREAMGSVQHAELASFMVVSLVGAWLCGRSLLRLFRAYRHPSRRAAASSSVGQVTPGSAMVAAHAGRAAGFGVRPEPSSPPAAGCGCGHDHHIDPQTAGDWRTALLTVFSIGIRPCSGGVLLLGAAALLDQFFKGVVAVMAMSLGTALTVSALALLSVLAREWVKRHLGTRAAGRPWQAWFGLAGGALILTLGLSLTLAWWQRGESGAPPLLGTPSIQTATPTPSPFGARRD